MIGIYKITNLINGKNYIGQSISIERRFREHKRRWKEKTSNTPFYQAIRKYGIENFSFEIVEECPKENLDSRESYWIKHLESMIYQKGYNVLEGGMTSSRGVSLDREIVLFIKEQIRNTDLSFAEIGNSFGVSHVSIVHINQGYSWAEDGEEYPIRKKHEKDEFSYKDFCSCGELKWKTSKKCLSCANIGQRKGERPCKEELKKEIRELSFVEIGKKYGVSDNTIRNWCDCYNLPRRKNDILRYSKEEWDKI